MANEENILGRKEDVKYALKALGIKEGDKPVDSTEGGPKIRLPEDEGLKESLEKKLGEYKVRVGKLFEKNPYWAPERIWGTDAGYKAIILERVLDNGEVDTWQLSKELHDKHGFIDINAFENACGVIDDYCRSGGQNVKGGSGL